MEDNRVDTRLGRIEAHLERMGQNISGIAMTLWGPSGNPYTEEALGRAREAAERFREAREKEFEALRQGRIVAGKDPDGFDAEDEFESQMS